MWLAGELVEKLVPDFAVVVPSTEMLYALNCGFAKFVLEGRVVCDLLHTCSESVDVTVGDDEAFAAVGEEIFGSSGGGGEDWTSAGHGLSLNKSETFFDAG